MLTAWIAVFEQAQLLSGETLLVHGGASGVGTMAIQMARDVYTRRQEGTSVWVVRSDQIVASDPADKDMYFDPMEDKVYRHPTFYDIPDEVKHI